MSDGKTHWESIEARLAELLRAAEDANERIRQKRDEDERVALEREGRVRADRDRLRDELEEARAALGPAECHRDENLAALNRTARERDEALARVAELERVADENYQELLDNMEESWGGLQDYREPVGRSEIAALVSSRIVHKPAASLRARVAELEAENSRLKADDGSPWYACVGCGRCARDGWKIVENGGPMDPKDYDMVCPDCGSNHVQESALDALNKRIRIDDQRAEKLEAENARLRGICSRSYMRLPLVGADLAFGDSDIEPHVTAVADEFAIRTAQLAAERKENERLRGLIAAVDVSELKNGVTMLDSHAVLDVDEAEEQQVALDAIAAEQQRQREGGS